MKYIFIALLLSFTLNASQDDVVVDEYPLIKPIAIEDAPQREESILEAAVQEAQSNSDAVMDSDNDGVLDDIDQCPKTPKGILVEENGCEKDTDFDGVVDSKDRCPNTSREFKVDDIGCPLVAKLQINFPYNKYVIPKSELQNLMNFTKFLKENTGYEIIIYGYTDNIGKVKNNKILSRNRARSVKQALISNGIKAIRLTAIGKGEAFPIADNNTEHGRAKNRRIEAELIE